MSGWIAEFEEEAIGDLNQLTHSVRNSVLTKIAWLRVNFENITPQPLGGEWRGFFKLRVGDYRAIYAIDWRTYCLTVVLIDHRSRVYKRKSRNN